MAISSPEPVKDRHVEFNLSGQTVQVPYSFTNDQTEVLLTTGFGERDITGIARGLGERGLSVAVTRVVYPNVSKLTDDIIEASILGSHTAVIADLNLRADRPEGTPIIGVSNSKGAGEQLLAAAELPEYWRELHPVSPLGLTSRSLGSDFRQQRRELVDRIQAAGLTDDIMKASDAADMRGLRREFMDGITYAFGHDSIPMVAKLVRLGILHKILVGENDEIFTPYEFIDDLSPAGLSGLVKTLPGVGHISLNSESGLDSMAALIKAYVPEAAT